MDTFSTKPVPIVSPEKPLSIGTGFVENLSIGTGFVENESMLKKLWADKVCAPIKMDLFLQYIVDY